MSEKYISLEPEITKELGIKNQPTFNGQAVSFFATSSFVYTLLFMAIVAASFYRYVLAGIWRMEASESGIRKSNEEFKRVTLGLLGVFSLFLILFTLNKDLLRGNVGLEALAKDPNVERADQAAASVSEQKTATRVAQPSSSGTSKACDSPQNVLASIAYGNVCRNTSCTVLAGCDLTYLQIIKDESKKQGLANYKIATALMCKESRGKVKATNLNPGGSYDCGLMQINNGKSPCESNPSLFDPETNIAKGVSLLVQRINANKAVYPSVPQIAGVFATYNCCADGTPANAPSVSCTNETGFSTQIPKWACPIDPGTGTFNMCGVKSYACEITACIDQVP
jgi:hypothetical protein